MMVIRKAMVMMVMMVMMMMSNLVILKSFWRGDGEEVNAVSCQRATQQSLIMIIYDDDHFDHCYHYHV